MLKCKCLTFTFKFYRRLCICKLTLALIIIHQQIYECSYIRCYLSQMYYLEGFCRKFDNKLHVSHVYHIWKFSNMLNIYHVSRNRHGCQVSKLAAAVAAGVLYWRLQQYKLVVACILLWRSPVLYFDSHHSKKLDTA